MGSTCCNCVGWSSWEIVVVVVCCMLLIVADWIVVGLTWLQDGRGPRMTPCVSKLPGLEIPTSKRLPSPLLEYKCCGQFTSSSWSEFSSFVSLWFGSAWWCGVCWTSWDRCDCWGMGYLRVKCSSLHLWQGDFRVGCLALDCCAYADIPNWLWYPIIWWALSWILPPPIW
jgi:hypothetical protein